jgi:redox-sensing transcriptional repressor
MGDRRIPQATVARLPIYLQVLVEASEVGTTTLSSDELAQGSGLNSAKVRKDLSFLGTYGTRGVGYDVAELTTEISQVLGLVDDRAVVIVGVGNLGSALASYDGFDRRGFGSWRCWTPSRSGSEPRSGATRWSPSPTSGRSCANAG